MLSMYKSLAVVGLMARNWPVAPRCIHAGLKVGREESGETNLVVHKLPSLLLRRAHDYRDQLQEMEVLLSKGERFDSERQEDYSRASIISDTLKHYTDSLNDLNELQNMVKMDPSLRYEAQSELAESIPVFNQYSNKLLQELIPPHPFASKACILELRPGVGGEEAMIFTQEMLNMYINYCHRHRWKYHIISQQQNESGSGLISAIISIDGLGSYDTFRFESGVHRVQRVPATETKGRTHTSTAAVVVLPQMGEETDQVISAYERTFKPGEIRIDVKRASGKGGQHVNTTDSAVRLTHIPSGIVVSMQDERSQQKNKTKAFSILRARLAEKERKEKDDKERAARKEQISSTDRSDKIRTYNYPQNRVTDHRCGFTLHDVPGTLSGERLDELVEEMRDFDAKQSAEKLLTD